MKGIQVQGTGKASLTELPLPQRKEGYAIIKVMAASICGTDVSTYRGTNVNVSSYPIVIGHETAGIVEDVDENNQYGIKKGDHVVLDPYLYCGVCYPCSQGKTNCCETLHCLGVHCDGSMCEYFAHPVHMLRKVPQDMPWERVPSACWLAWALWPTTPPPFWWTWWTSVWSWPGPSASLTPSTPPKRTRWPGLWRSPKTGGWSA